ncbi:polyprenyl synthetase family protein [Phreatobacter aquaticus]|uniref:Probable farnesyl diphosphate synthase n=1 Tax=Phreatobacter aquaticus TaxID=2570229 RepID=A0A4D7QLP3_9HYPH|nr:farnesyl diphosphate synthase [Phreatobacter aquaticus]QCK86274.1 polyprenyl synthetase family protein [Phreatobacter aquaticus]
MVDTPFAAALAEVAGLVEAALQNILDDAPLPGETARPERLIGAMRHAVLAGGKRLRPFLVVETARLFGVPDQSSIRAGAALELVHCYSLVHDDLPAMDDDDLRRGRPTVHKAFDDASAILAGDALLTLAFDVMADERVDADAAVRIQLVQALARASGLGGMAGGQMLDLAAEGRFGDGRPQLLDDAAIRRLQAMKTGALIRFGCVAGAILGRASAAERAALDAYGAIIGLAFQIADDLIDHEGDAASAGKATGKDAARGKGTLVSLNGAAWAREELARLVGEAETKLAAFGPRADRLKEAARFIAMRDV